MGGGNVLRVAISLPTGQKSTWTEKVSWTSYTLEEDNPLYSDLFLPEQAKSLKTEVIKENLKLF